ncbi:MAG: polyketide synthase, partial [Chloroflexi bacterium]
FTAGAGLPDLPPATLLSSDDEAVFGFNKNCHGWRVGEGAGAVALMSYDRAVKESRRVYALIRAAAASDGIALDKENQNDSSWLPSAPLLDDVRSCCRAALEEARITPEQVGYLEAFASGNDALDGIEIAGSVQAYRSPVQDLSTVLGGVQGNTGYLGASSGLASLIRAAVCIYQRILPAAPGWSGPKLPALWRCSPFYVPQESRTWFSTSNSPESAGYGRTAGVNILGRNGSFAHLILSEPDGQPEPTNQALVNSGFYLIPLSASGPDELVQQLDRLKQALSGPVDLKDLSARKYAEIQANECQPYALAVVGHDPDEICREIDYALNAVPSAFEKGTDWQTPLGSYFTPRPAGQIGGVALVYPGAFNSYPGVGKDLFYLFPDLHRHSANITTDLGRVIHERMLYPRSLTGLSKDEMTALEAKLLADPIAMLISGTTMAILYTHILLEIFKVQPAAAFGYSLGENSMMYATGVWGQGDGASDRLAESDTFRSRLAGPQQAIREYWGISEENHANGQPLWSNYLVMST